MTLLASYDVAIVGGGISGCAVARELSRYQLSVALFEAAPDIACGTSKANGGVVHPGNDPRHGTLKAKLNVRGNKAYHRLADELNFKFKQTGSLMVGIDESERTYVEGIYNNGLANGVGGMEFLNYDQARAIEPWVNPQAKVFLYTPSTGVVDPYEVTIALAENAAINGVAIRRSCDVRGISRINGGFILHTVLGDFSSRLIINAAGVYADRVAAMVGDKHFTIKPRLGEILVFDKDMDANVRTVLYPVPSVEKKSKGVCVVPSVNGNVLVTATAKMVDDKEDLSTSSAGIAELIGSARKMVPELNTKLLIREFTGLRAVALDTDNDFIIAPAPGVPGFINVAGIQSPGVASAPAVAEIVRDLVADQGVELKEKLDFNPDREAPVNFRDLPEYEQDRLIKANPDYGQIICRCELVTAGEIIDAIRRPVGATTIDGIKRRTRAGAGRCQGGFCQPKVLAILAQELDLPNEQVWLEYQNSQVVSGFLKEAHHEN